MMVINLSGALMDKIRIQMRQCIHFFERVFIIQIIMIQCNSRAGQLSESKPYSLFFFFITIGAFFPAKNCTNRSAYPHVLPFLTQSTYGRLCTAFCCVSLKLLFNLKSCNL